MSKNCLNDLNRTFYLNILKTLCQIFWGPDISLCQDIISGELTKLLQEIAVSFKIDQTVAIQAVARIAAEYKSTEALYSDLSESYVALFVNDINEITAPLYHSCYQTSHSRLMGPPAIDMKNRLKRHGLSISLPGNEPADHLCIELEYIYYLLARGWSESNRELVNEAVQFCRESMADWVRQLCEKVTADGRFMFYVAGAELMRITIQRLSEMTNCQESISRTEPFEKSESLSFGDIS